MKKLITLISTIVVLQSCNTNHQHGIGNYITPHCQENHVSNLDNKTYNPYDKVIIIGLNDVPKSRVLEAERIVKSFFKLRVEIKPNETIPSSFYLDSYQSSIDPDKLINNYNTTDKIILLTNKRMFTKTTEARGYTYYQGKVLVTTSGEYLQETLIHEMGHTYGLWHCSDLTCIMAIYNDAYDSGTYCQKCKNQIGFN